MATGIVSLAAWLQHLQTLSNALLVIACIGWVVLALALGPRLRTQAARQPRLESFALVAATAVLGSRLSLAGHADVALALWALAAGCWLALLASRPRRGRAGGGWLLVVVATESLAVLASLLAPRWGAALLDVALACWLLGLFLYLAVMVALAAELLGRRLTFGPALWITMGALAIATLAGTQLLLAAEKLQLLAPLQSTLRRSDLAIWALASACILPLIAAELHHRSRWRDARGRWSFVFPLGMYAVASQSLERPAALPPLTTLGRAFFVIALTAWVVVLLAFSARYAD